MRQSHVLREVAMVIIIITMPTQRGTGKGLSLVLSLLLHLI